MDSNIKDMPPSIKRTLVGEVVSNKRNKTVAVRVKRRVKQPLYGKYVVRAKKYPAHDEANAYNEGDRVEIQETRPFSKTKSWVVSLDRDNTGCLNMMQLEKRYFSFPTFLQKFKGCLYCSVFLIRARFVSLEPVHKL